MLRFFSITQFYIKGKQVKKIRKEGFTLIELSVLITIMSIIFTSSIVVKDVIENHNKAVETEAKIIIIKQYLANYFRRYKKLPCPADLLRKITDSKFGVSNQINGNCSRNSKHKKFSVDNFYG